MNGSKMWKSYFSVLDKYYSILPSEIFPVSIQHAVIHLHIPKTAGTAIRHSLFGSSVIKHVPACEIPLAFWEVLPSLAVIRHPLDRFVSSYKYHVKSPYRGVLLKRHPDLKTLSLSDYASRFIGKSNLLMCQKDFISRNDSSKKIVDHLIRFENLDDDLSRVFKELDISIEIKPTKVGVKDSIDVPKGVQKLVEKFYAKDFDAFGY